MVSFMLKRAAWWFPTSRTLIPALKRRVISLFPFRTFWLEASVSYANSLQNMLIQSWGGTIRVFPAMPTEEWPDATFHNLRAEGAFLVSASRRDNQTQWARVKSLAGEPCLVRPGLEGELKILSDGPVELIDLGD